MLVTIDSYINFIEAHIVRGRLEAEGLNAYVIHDQHIAAKWWLALVLGGVKIQVHPSDVEVGKQILQSLILVSMNRY